MLDKPRRIACSSLPSPTISQRVGDESHHQTRPARWTRPTTLHTLHFWKTTLRLEIFGLANTADSIAVDSAIASTRSRATVPDVDS